MYRIVALSVATALASCQPTSSDYSAVFDGKGGRWVDLTHSFSESTIYWPTDTVGFLLEQQEYGPTEGGWFYASYEFESAEHGGTHLDAPIHFSEGGLTNERIALSSLIGPAAVVDVSNHADADYLITVADLTAWESEHGQLPNKGILLLRTGWSSRWNNRTAYLGTDLTGPEAVAELHFPGLDPSAATWLIDNREIVSVGIDTPSIDYGQSTDFRSHVILYSQNLSGFENITNLDLLPPRGSFVVALPMKIEDGSGGPLRIVAFVPTGTTLPTSVR